MENNLIQVIQSLNEFLGSSRTRQIVVTVSEEELTQIFSNIKHTHYIESGNPELKDVTNVSSLMIAGTTFHFKRV